MEKNTLFWIISGIILLGLISLIVFFIVNGESPNIDGNTNNSNPGLKTYYIDKEGPIPLENCDAGNLKNKIIVIESRYCGACKILKDTISEIEKISKYKFQLYDIIDTEQRSYIEDTLKLDYKYTPTMIIGCDAYIGAKDKATLLDILGNYNLDE